MSVLVYLIGCCLAVIVLLAVRLWRQPRNVRVAGQQSLALATLGEVASFTVNLPGIGIGERPLHQSTAELIARHGSVVELSPLPGKLLLLVSDADLVSQVRSYPKPDSSQRSYQEMTPYGLLAMQDPVEPSPTPSMWKQHRRFLQPYFARAFVNGLRPAVVAATQHALQHWRRTLAADRSHDVHGLLTNLTLDIIARTAFGYDQLAVDAPDAELQQAFRVAMDWISYAQFSPVKLWKLLPTPGHRQFLRARQRIYDLIERTVVSARQRLALEAPAAKPTNFLEALLQAPPPDDTDCQDNSGHDNTNHDSYNSVACWTDQELRDETITIMAAGHETTNNTLTFFFDHVARRPDVQARLHEEIDRLLPPGSASAQHFPDPEAFTYLNMCLKESLRLTPAVPLVSRVVPRDAVVGGVQLRRGTTILIDIGSLHRHADHWQRPHDFHPEHFLPDADKARHPFAYVPFGAGVKSCIGSRFAMLEARIIAILLLSEFRIAPDPAHRMHVDWKITAKPANGCLLFFTPREK